MNAQSHARLATVLALVFTCTSVCVRERAGARCTVPPPVQAVAEPGRAAETSWPGEDLDAKRRDVMRLIELSGARQVALVQLEVMMQQIRSSASVPPAMAETMKEELDSALDQLIALSVLPYMRHTSHADIKAMIAFYETPEGQRMGAAAPSIMRETGESAAKWGQEMALRLARRQMETRREGGAGTSASADAPVPSAPSDATPSAPPAPKALQPDLPEATVLVQRIRTRYAQARTYRDSGTGRAEGDGAYPATELEFSTAFARRGGFKWMFSLERLPHKPFVVWSADCRSWKTRWGLEGEVKSHDSLQSALAGPTGISLGLAQIIPPLLRADGGEGTLFVRMGGKRVIGREPLRGVWCDIMESVGPKGGTDSITLWVDSTGAIRKYVEKSTIEPAKIAQMPGLPKEEVERMRKEAPYVSTKTFLFQPEFDVELAPEETALALPAGPDAPAMMPAKPG